MRQSTLKLAILKMAAVTAIAVSLSGCIIIAKDSDPNLTPAPTAGR